MKYRIKILAIVMAGIVPSLHAEAELSGNLAIEYRSFQHAPTTAGIHQNNISASTQPEYYRDWDNGKYSFIFVPFARVDQHDTERTHADIRELNWLMVSDWWELRAGIGKVFWGVTESQHLVDVINQTDAIENSDGEDKLGQPMVDLTLIGDWGTVDLFILPGFRERTFAGSQSRLQFAPPGLGNPQYESSDKENHIDFAIRWAKSIEKWDIAISHFSGTNREPELITTTLPFSVRYNLMEQTGLELQAIIQDWIVKLEVIARDSGNESFVALTGGFENTLVGIANSQADLGFLAEYLYDDRDEKATTPFANDLLIGTRLALNDTQSSELLAGIILDLDNDSRLFTLEASRRIGNNLKINIEAKIFSHIDKNDLFYTISQDDHVQTELVWYF